jgi:hypothetical protein
METWLDPYLSRPIRRARAAGVVGAWLIWATAFGVAFTAAPRFVPPLLLVLGFIPYIVSIKFVEPWLMRRAASQWSTENVRRNDG